MTPVQITDYAKFLQNPYILHQFIGIAAETDAQKVFASNNAQYNEEEAMFYGLLNGIQLANAIGVQLDEIGAGLNLARNGLADGPYRTALYIQAQLNTTCGQPEDLYTVLADLMGCLNVKIGDYFPAKVWVDQDSSFTFYDLFMALNPLIPAGVGLGIQGYLMDTYGDNIVDNNGNTIICTVWGIPPTPAVPGGLTEALLETSGGDLVVTYWGQQIAAWE